MPAKPACLHPPANCATVCGAAAPASFFARLKSDSAGRPGREVAELSRNGQSGWSGEFGALRASFAPAHPRPIWHLLNTGWREQLNTPRSTRRSSKRTSRIIKDEEPAPPSGKRRPRRKTARAAKEKTGVQHPRLGDDAVVKKWQEQKPSDIARRKRAKKPPASTRTVILAMSPNAANILRAMLGRANHDVPELDAIRIELEDQLK